MDDMIYSPKVAIDIINRFSSRGWNFYKRDHAQRIDADETIRKNLAGRLELDVPYVLLPAAEDPCDPKQVFDALEVLAQRLGRQMPTIRVGGETYPLTGITLHEREVKIHTPEGTWVSYPVFLRALDSIVHTK